jgi:hypothetical protein
MLSVICKSNECQFRYASYPKIAKPVNTIRKRPPANSGGRFDQQVQIKVL